MKSNLFLFLANSEKHSYVQLLHPDTPPGAACGLDLWVERQGNWVVWVSHKIWKRPLEPQLEGPSVCTWHILFQMSQKPRSYTWPKEHRACGLQRKPYASSRSPPDLAPKRGADFSVWSWNLPEGRRTTRMCGKYLAFVPASVVSEACLIWNRIQTQLVDSKDTVSPSRVIWSKPL